jgi:type III secretory pathway component EscU
MKHIPTLPKIVLNILLYIFYVLIISLVFSFVFPQILTFLDKPIPDVNDPIFYKTQIVILVLVLIVTVIARKYLYIWFCHYHDEEDKRVEKKNQTNDTAKKETKKAKVESDTFDDEMKIYIDKEIK